MAERSSNLSRVKIPAVTIIRADDSSFDFTCVALSLQPQALGMIFMGCAISLTGWNDGTLDPDSLREQYVTIVIGETAYTEGLITGWSRELSQNTITLDFMARNALPMQQAQDAHKALAHG